MPLKIDFPTYRTNRNYWWFVLAALVSCLPRAALASDVPVFVRDIRPILAEHCYACHGPDSGSRHAGLRLDRPEGATARLESGQVAVQPGKVKESQLVARIESVDPEFVMPPPETKRALNARQKELLRRWIEAGASYSEHWAYRNPQRPVLPATTNNQWSRNQIDRFVLAKLESFGLVPSPEARRATLVRRLSLDLIGLPPTLEEVDEWLGDAAPDAYERLVDRLLASPHFGEKLALDWLDLARFGDSSGYQDDGDRPNFPYRDYVIQAFNADLPFDRFTIENLAGDLLPSATSAQRVASGFNRLHRHNEEGGSDPDEFQVVYVVDRTNTVGATWMGITLGCAQCHDHKYDPISQREYYQLYAFFNSLKGEVVISKAASPPQIRVPSAADLWRLERLGHEIASAERREQDVAARARADFETWLKAQKESTSTREPPITKTGAVGGVVARSRHTAWYADTRLAGPLSLADPIGARGRIAMIRSVNNIVDVGHFSARQNAGGGNLGMMAAEGPRYFACVVLASGARLLSPPIAGEHGVEYSWSYRYEPAGGVDDPADADSVGEGLLTLELQRAGVRVGTTSIDLTAEQRKAGAALDAFGIQFRGASDADSPLELFIDDVEYSISADMPPRQQDFHNDPEWKGDGNLANGHFFGFDPSATTAGGVSGLSTEQVLASPNWRNSPLHVARLRDLFTAEKLPELRAIHERLTALRAERESVEKSLPLALVWEELEQPRPAQILKRGDYRLTGETVERNVPAVFPKLPAGTPRDRMALAQWLVCGQHPLTARVAVNRLWKQCFGAGLVRTPEDFGIRGEPPTHPELLDWLALEFSGHWPRGDLESPASPAWDIKQILRRMVTSATYRQSSTVAPRLREIDPDNRQLARGARFRLPAEEIRDAALTAAGLLTRRIGGRSVYPYQPDHFYRDKEDDPGEWKWPLESGSELYRRGLYTFLRRTTPYPSYQTFDAPSRGECTVARSRTTTPQQALVTLNDPAFVESARVLGEQIARHDGDDAARLTFAFRRVLSRSPTARELAVLDELIKSSRKDNDGDNEVAWTAVASTLLNLDEAITRE